MLEWGGLHHHLTLEDIKIAFGQKNPKMLLIKNPALDLQAVNEIFSHMGSYLWLKTYEDQRSRGLASVGNYKAAVENEDALDTEILLQQMATDLLTEPCCHPATSPEYIILEDHAKIRLRKEQFAIMKLFLETGDVNLIKELVVGWGKSSVLLPLLGLLRAKPETLSLLIVTEQLFESTGTKTHGVLRDAFAHSLHALKIDRHTSFSIESLQMIALDLNNIIKNRESLIMTSGSLQCLLLKGLELLQTISKTKEFNRENIEKITAMRTIVGILKKSGYPLIDEVDSVLDVMFRLVFSFGSKQPPRTRGPRTDLSSIYSITNLTRTKKTGTCRVRPKLGSQCTSDDRRTF